MQQLLNFHDAFIVAQHNWWLVLVALGLGIWLGWSKTTWHDEQAN